MENIQWLNDLLGLDKQTIEPQHMVFRAVLLFFIALIYIRIAGVRTLGKQSPFDHLTILMLGAIMGRAIVANQSFSGSLLAALVLMLLHRLVALITFKSSHAGKIFKGTHLVLYKNGNFINDNLSKTHITKEDIKESVREEINSDEMSKVKQVHIERSGHISVTKVE